jgi:hypothetical protein
MKKRIIATILLVVMVLGTLASCGSYKFSDEKNFGDYAYVTDYNALLTALKNIVVDDVDFAIDETERLETVKDQIYGKLADVLVKNASSKKTTGTVGTYDVVDYYYYCTVEVDGVTYKFDYAKMVGSASQMKLPLYDKSEAGSVNKGIYDALKGAELTEDTVRKLITAGTVKNEKTYIVSYKVKSEDLDASGNTVASEEETTVSYEIITIDTAKALDYFLVNGKKTGESSHDTANRPSIGTSSSNVKTFELETTENLAAGATKKVTTYTDFTIHCQVEKEGTEKTFTYTNENEREITTAIANGETKLQTITVPAEAVITYHVYPAARYEFTTTDVTAEQIVRDILGSAIKANSISIFSDEDLKYTYKVLDYVRYTEAEGDHKVGDIKYDADGNIEYVVTKDDAGAEITKEATLKEIVEALVKEYANDATKAYAEVEAVKTAKAALDAATEELKAKEEAYNTAKAAYDAAKKAVDDAGDNATDEQKTALTNAETTKTDAENAKTAATTAKTNANSALTKAQNDTKKAKVEVLTRHLLSGTRTKDEATVNATDDIVAAYTKDNYATLEAAHDEALTKAIGKEVWEIFEANVTVDLDHKDLKSTLKKYKDTLYEQYEYQYYKGATNNASNYSQYDSVEEYIKAAIKKETGKTVLDVDKTLTEMAKDSLKDQLIVYAVAKALVDNDADANYATWIAENKEEWEAMYKHSYEHNDSELSDEEIQEKFDEYYEAVENEAANLLVTNKVMKEYKKEVGRAQYNLYVDNYGEENLRMTLQFTRLMNFILYTDYTEDTHAAHDGEYKIAYSGNKIAYRFIEYKLQSEVDAANTNP